MMGLKYVSFLVALFAVQCIENTHAMDAAAEGGKHKLSGSPAADIQNGPGPTDVKIHKLLQLAGLTGLPPKNGALTFAAQGNRPQAIYHFDNFCRPSRVEATFTAMPSKVNDRKPDKQYIDYFIQPSGLEQRQNKKGPGASLFKAATMSPGHILALEFGPPITMLNFVPQSATSNQGNIASSCWRKMENALLAILKFSFTGKTPPKCTVIAKMQLHYDIHGKHTKMVGENTNRFFQSIYPEKMQMTLETKPARDGGGKATDTRCLALDAILRGKPVSSDKYKKEIEAFVSASHITSIAQHRANGCNNYDP